MKQGDIAVITQNGHPQAAGVLQEIITFEGTKLWGVSVPDYDCTFKFRQSDLKNICSDSFYLGGSRVNDEADPLYCPPEEDELLPEDEDYWIENCGQVKDNEGTLGCTKAGSEECDFECPFRDELEVEEVAE